MRRNNSPEFFYKYNLLRAACIDVGRHIGTKSCKLHTWTQYATIEPIDSPNGSGTGVKTTILEQVEAVSFWAEAATYSHRVIGQSVHVPAIF